MLQVGIGPQGDFVDGEFAGIGAAHRHEVDQGGDLVDLRGVDLGAGGDILVGALAQDTADPAGHALDLRLQRVGNLGADRRELAAPGRNRCAGRVRCAGPRTPSCSVFRLLADVVEMAAPDVGAQAGRRGNDRSCSAIVTAMP